jgi:putative transposase
VNDKNRILKTYKYPLSLSKTAEHTLFQWSSACRYLWNRSLRLRNALYEETGTKIDYYGCTYPTGTKTKCGLSHDLTLLRAQYDWLAAVPNCCQQKALMDMDQAFANFFRRMKQGAPRGEAGHPRSKPRWILTRLFFPKNRIAFHYDSGKRAYLTVSKIENPLRVVYDPDYPLIGEISSATIQNSYGKWFVSFLMDATEGYVKPIPPIGEPIGLDMGVTKTYALSNGETYSIDDNKIKCLEDRIAHLQKRQARMVGAKKGEKKSGHWLRIKHTIDRHQREIAYMRENFNHHVSKKLASKHSRIVIEDLRIKNMSASAAGTVDQPGKNVAAKSGLNRAILRNGWGEFRVMLDYKTKNFGSELHAVPPQYTSQTCRKCGLINPDNRSGEKFECIGCGYMADADVNAAQNILDRYKSPAGSPGCAPGVAALAG